MRSILRSIPVLFSERIELLSLELQRAGKALLNIVVLGLALAVLAFTAWSILMALIITGLVMVGWHWITALCIALAVQVLIGSWLLNRLKMLLPMMQLPATRRHLAFASDSLKTADPDTSGSASGPVESSENGIPAFEESRASCPSPR